MMVRLGLAMVVGVAPALVSWWKGQGSWLLPPLVVPSPCTEKAPKSWAQRRSPSLSDCLESSSDEDSARSIVCLVRPKLVSLSIPTFVALYNEAVERVKVIIIYNYICVVLSSGISAIYVIKMVNGIGFCKKSHENGLSFR